MTPERLLKVFSLVSSAAISGCPLGRLLAEVRGRPWYPGHDVTDEEVAEVLGMPVAQVLERLPRPQD